MEYSKLSSKIMWILTGVILSCIITDIGTLREYLKERGKAVKLKDIKIDVMESPNKFGATWETKFELVIDYMDNQQHKISMTRSEFCFFRESLMNARVRFFHLNTLMINMDQIRFINYTEIN